MSWCRFRRILAAALTAAALASTAPLQAAPDRPLPARPMPAWLDTVRDGLAALWQAILGITEPPAGTEQAFPTTQPPPRPTTDGGSCIDPNGKPCV